MTPERDPESVISTLVDQLYIEQFLHPAGIVFSHFTGGAITGVYSNQSSCISWPNPRTIQAFLNTGGQGLDANFQWLPIIYKTWHYRGNFFSSSCFEQNGKWFKRLTVCSNGLSDKLQITETALPVEAGTFNSPTLSLVLIPGLSPPIRLATMAIQGAQDAFKESFSEDGLIDVELPKEFVKNLDIDDLYFLKTDGFIALSADALRARADWISDRLLQGNVPEPQRFDYLQKKAVALRKLGFNFGKPDQAALSDSLTAWIDTYEFCASYKRDSLNDAIHNIGQFLNDLKERCNPHTFSAILEKDKGRLALIHAINFP